MGIRKGGEKLKKKKCYIYTRVSTAAQTEGYSLDAQKERIRQFAEYKDLEIAGEYCDAGKSGHSIKGRPSFMEMLDDITSEKDGISFVLVYKLSRFGRNAADVLKSMQLLMDYDVDLVCVEDSIDSSTQGGRLTLAILSAVAEIERENINVQFMAGKMQKILDGGWSGGPLPYGYQNVNKQPEIVPSEAEIVKLIYEMYLQPDTGYATIARWLNDHGYTRMVSDEEKPFTAGFITNVLKNPFYCGRLCYNRRTNSEKIRKNPKTAICIQGKHQAIVSEDIWDEAETKRNESPGKNENTTDPERISLLSGLVKCPECGNGMVAMKNRKINRNHGGHYKVLYYYACRYHRKAEGRTCSFRHTYNQEKLDGAVLEIIGQVASTKEFREAFAKAVGSKKSVDEIEAELKSLRKSLHSEEHKKYKLGEDLDHLDVLSNEFESEYEAITVRIDETYDRIYELQEQIDKKRERLAALRNGVDSSDNVRMILDNFDRLFRSMNYEERREMCRLFIQRIDVFPEEQEDGRILRQIVFKIPVYYNLASDAGGKDDPDDEVTFVVDCTKFQATVTESKATYTEIKAKVLEDTGLKVSALYIAQIKRKYGIDMGVNYNKPADPEKRVPKCPKEKELAILEALKSFRMLTPDTEYFEQEA